MVNNIELNTVNLANNFVMYCEAEVTYNGRAQSTSKKGNYLIIHKRDGSFVIHNAENCKPMNYQTKKSILSLNDDILTSKSKHESISVKIYKLNHYYELDDWCTDPINLTGSEFDLREKFIQNYHTNLGMLTASEAARCKIYKEFKTPFGNIDLLIIVDNFYFVLEFKRGKASLAACSQLKRYVDYLVGIGKDVNGYLVSPNISKPALDYIMKCNMLWHMQFDFNTNFDNSFLLTK